MPSIDIQVLEGVFDDAGKARIIESVTDAFGQAAGGDMKANTSVRIHEERSGSWGYGGTAMTTEDGLRIRGLN